MSPICPSISASSSLTEAKSMSSSSGETTPATETHRGKRSPNRKKDQAPRTPPQGPSQALRIGGDGSSGGGKGPQCGCGGSPAGFARCRSRGLDPTPEVGDAEAQAEAVVVSDRAGRRHAALLGLFVWFCFRFTEDLPRWIHIVILDH